MNAASISNTTIHRHSLLINERRVRNFLNGSYIVACARPPPGSCATVGVTVVWEHFKAFHNAEPYADGELAGAKGFQSHDSGTYRNCAEPTGQKPKLNACGKELVKAEHCEPPLREVVPEAGDVLSYQRSLTPSWERVDKAEVASRAVWQREWVWRSHNNNNNNQSAGAGGTRLASRSGDEGYRRCFGLEGKERILSRVDFMGDSHMDYLVTDCMMPEVFAQHGKCAKDAESSCERYSRKGVSGIGPDGFAGAKHFFGFVNVPGNLKAEVGR